jgi:hypothetical protein
MLSALTAIQAALEAEGIEFTEGDGMLAVKLKPKPKGKREASNMPRRTRRVGRARCRSRTDSLLTLC